MGSWNSLWEKNPGFYFWLYFHNYSAQGIFFAQLHYVKIRNNIFLSRTLHFLSECFTEDMTWYPIFRTKIYLWKWAGSQHWGGGSEPTSNWNLLKLIADYLIKCSCSSRDATSSSVGFAAWTAISSATSLGIHPLGWAWSGLRS